VEPSCVAARGDRRRVALVHLVDREAGGAQLLQARRVDPADDEDPAQ
jgi:hypothetical protein